MPECTGCWCESAGLAPGLFCGVEFLCLRSGHEAPLFTIGAQPLLDRVVELRMPAMHQWPEMAEEGGLIGYGPRFTGVFRQRARLVARVLRGAKPADIPVEQPTTFELVINLQTAKKIGHEIPSALVLRADKVIE
jgi:putative tryptophan/tyrosine transport system substrate-binding protein